MKFTRVRLVLAVLVIAMAVPAVAVAVSPFTDVIPGTFYEAPVEWAFNNGITTGKTATTFEPDAVVTRGETVTFLKRYNDNIVKQTVGSLACTTGQIPVFGGTDWTCGSDQTVPDSNTDALGSLSCTTDQVAHYDGTDWVCGTTKLAVGLTPTGISNIPINISPAGGFGEYSSIAIGTDGRPIIAHVDGASSNLLVSHCNAPDCSTGAVTTTLDTGAPGDMTGTESSITIGADGFPIISYRDTSALTLKAYHCTAADCSTGGTTTLDTPGGSGPFYTSITIGTDGFPIISYGTTSSLKAYHCTAAACSTGDTAVTLATGGHGGFFTSIAIGTDGFPIISYQDDTNSNLMTYHCTKVDCSTSDTPKTLDTGGPGEFAGYFTSISIGADGLPIISYSNRTPPAGSLEAYHCTAIDCSTGDTPTTLDTWSTLGASSGATTSIATGGDGLPIVSYIDNGNGHLKAYRCGTRDCSTGGISVALNSTTVARYAALAIGVDGRPIVSYHDANSSELMVARAFPTVTIAFG